MRMNLGKLVFMFVSFGRVYILHRVPRTVGYIDFNNLFSQTFDGCQIKFYDTFIKYVFVFLSGFVRFWLKSLQKVILQYDPRKFIYGKYINKYQKTQNLMLIPFESVKKVEKIKNILTKTWRMYTLFSLSLMFINLFYLSYIYLGSSVCLSSCHIPVVLSYLQNAELFFMFKNSNWRSRRDGEIGEGETEEGGSEKTFLC